MKIIDIVYYGWLSAPNGVSSFLKEFLNNKQFFAEKDMDLNVFSLDYSLPRNFEIEKHSFVKRCKNVIRNIAPYNAYLSWLLLEKSVFRFAKKSVDRYILLKREADIICFHDLFACYIYLQKRGNNSSKIILFLHCDGNLWDLLKKYYPKLAKKPWTDKFEEIEQYVLSRIDKIGFVSIKAQEVFLYNHQEFDKQKTISIYNGIQNIHYPFPCFKGTPKFRLCCVASIKPMKGQMLILEALNALLPEEKEQFALTFVGGGNYEKGLREYCRENNLDNIVSFTGVVTNVVDYLNKSNVFVLMSYSEGLSIAILEAMRIGLPIISTDVGGASEQVEDLKNGVLLATDSRQLLEIFKNLCAGKYDIEKMGKASRQIFEEKFTIEKSIENYALLFNEL